MTGLRTRRSIGPTRFFRTIKQKDWVALVTFDMKSRVKWISRRTKMKCGMLLYHLYFPGFSESNVFDAILDTTEPFKRREGQESDFGAGHRRGYVF